ncbi:MAG: sulfur transferase domain-containing protein [Woeseiaceae bacterium]|nr:sulfur transferase domain-containing protein [Woeseiaceae bacterium]
MYRLILSLLAAAALLPPAVAGELPPIKADLDAVVESGVVRPVDGLTTSGQPDEAALEVLTDNGFVAVIDLRGADEDRGIDEQGIVDDLGMTYVSLPIEGRAALNFENARKLDEALAEFDGPVLIHCGSSNRAGALVALRAVLNGTDPEEALQLGRSAGMTSLEQVVREQFEADEDDG